MHGAVEENSSANGSRVSRFRGMTYLIIAGRQRAKLLHPPALQAGGHSFAVQDCLEVHHETFAIAQPAPRELPPACPVFVMCDCDYNHIDWRKIVHGLELDSVFMLEFCNMREWIGSIHVNAECL